MTGGLYDLEFALAALAVLFIAAGSMVWVTPKSADYLGELLIRRAHALTVARIAYQRAWNPGRSEYGIWLTKLKTASIEEADWSSRPHGELSVPSSKEHRGGCMGHS